MMALNPRKEIEVQTELSFYDRKNACTQTEPVIEVPQVVPADPPVVLAEVPVDPPVIPTDPPAGQGAAPLKPTKVDMRGKHWQVKAEKGIYPNPNASVVKWAGIRAKKQEEFKKFCVEEKYDYSLPWDSAKLCPAKGNTLKVLFMDLVMLEFKKVITLKWDKLEDGLYGIMEIHVPPAGLAEFNAGLIPSWSSTPGGKSNRSKLVRKHWDTAGFVEVSDPVTGALDFTFSVQKADKMKCQFERHKESKKRKAEQAH